MNSRFRPLTLATVALTALAFASGCETSKCKTDEGEDATCAESLVRYTVSGANETLTQPYTAGMSLVVDNVKGHVRINEDPGAAGEVSITVEPFTYRGNSKDAEAKDEMTSKLGKSFEADANDPNLLIFRTDQLDGASDELGATIYVSLPPEFNGNLKLNSSGAGNVEEGDIIANYVASAILVDMNSGDLGDCDLDGSPTVVNTVANCDGQVEITNVSDNVDVHTTGEFQDDEPFAIRVAWAGISDTATGGTISTDEGHVELAIPSTGNFTMVAAANYGGTVQETNTPDTCMSSGDQSTSDTVTCGTNGGTFTVTAGADDAFENPANVYLDFVP